MPTPPSVHDDGQKSLSDIVFSMSTALPASVYGAYTYLAKVHGSEKAAALLYKVIEGLEDPSRKAFRDAHKAEESSLSKQLLKHIAPQPTSDPKILTQGNQLNTHLDWLKINQFARYDATAVKQQLAVLQTSIQHHRMVLQNRMNLSEEERTAHKNYIHRFEQDRQRLETIRTNYTGKLTPLLKKVPQQKAGELVQGLRTKSPEEVAQAYKNIYRNVERRVARMLGVPKGIIENPSVDSALLNRIHTHPKFVALLDQYVTKYTVMNDTHIASQNKWVSQVTEAHPAVARFMSDHGIYGHGWNPILTERSGDFTTSTATVRDRLKQEMVKHLPAEHLHTDRTRLALDNNSEFVSQMYETLRNELIGEVGPRDELADSLLSVELRKVDTNFHMARFRVQMQPRMVTRQPVEAVFDMPLAFRGQVRTSISTAIRNVGFFAVPGEGFNPDRVDPVTGHYTELFLKKDLQSYTQRVVELAGRTSKSMIAAMAHGVPTDAERMWRGLVNKTLRYNTPSIGSERDLTQIATVRAQSGLTSIGKYDTRKLQLMLRGVKSLKNYRKALQTGADVVFWDTEYMSRELMENLSQARNVPLSRTVTPYGLGAVRINPSLGPNQAFAKAQVFSKVYRLPDKLQLGYDWLTNYVPGLKSMGLAHAVNRAFHDKHLPDGIQIFKDLAEIISGKNHSTVAFSAGANTMGADIPLLQTFRKRHGYKAPDIPLFTRSEYAIDVESIYRFLGGMDERKSYSLSELIKRHGLEHNVMQSYQKAFGADGQQDPFLQKILKGAKISPDAVDQVRRSHMAAYDALATAHLAMQGDLIGLAKNDEFFSVLDKYERAIEQYLHNPSLTAKDNITALLNLSRGEAMFGPGGGNVALMLFSTSVSQQSAQKGAASLLPTWDIGPAAAFANWMRPQPAYWTHMKLTQTGKERALARYQKMKMPTMGGVVGSHEFAWRKEQWLKNKDLFTTPLKAVFAEFHDTLEDTILISEKLRNNFYESMGPTKRMTVDLSEESAEAIHKDLLNKVEDFLQAREKGLVKHQELTYSLDEVAGVPMVQDELGLAQYSDRRERSILTNVLTDPDTPGKLTLEYATVQGRLADYESEYLQNVLGVKTSLGKAKPTIAGSLKVLKGIDGEEIDLVVAAKQVSRREFGDAFVQWLEDRLHKVEYTQAKVKTIAELLFGKEGHTYVQPLESFEQYVGKGKARLNFSFAPGSAPYEHSAKVFSANPFKMTAEDDYQWDDQGRLLLDGDEIELSKEQRAHLKIHRVVNDTWTQAQLAKARKEIDELKTYLDMNFKGRPEHAEYYMSMDRQLTKLKKLYGETLKPGFERADQITYVMMQESKLGEPQRFVLGSSHLRTIMGGIFHGVGRSEFAKKKIGFIENAIGSLEGAVRLNNVDASLLTNAVERLIQMKDNGLTAEDKQHIREGLAAQKGINMVTDPATGRQLLREQYEEVAKIPFQWGASLSSEGALSEEEVHRLAKLRESVTDKVLLRKARSAEFFEYEGRIFDSKDTIVSLFGEEALENTHSIGGTASYMDATAYHESPFYRKGRWSDGKGMLKLALGKVYDFDIADELLKLSLPKNERTKILKEIREHNLNGRFRGSSIELPLLRTGAVSSFDSNVRIASKQELAFINLSRVVEAGESEEEVTKKIVQLVAASKEVAHGRRTGVLGQAASWHFNIGVMGTLQKSDMSTFLQYGKEGLSLPGTGLQDVMLSEKRMKALTAEAVRYGTITEQEAAKILQGEAPLRGIFTRHPIGPSATNPSMRCAFTNAYIDKSGKLPDGTIATHTMSTVLYGGDYDGDNAAFMVFNDKEFYKRHQDLRNYQMQLAVKDLKDIKDKTYLKFFDEGIQTGGGYRIRLRKQLKDGMVNYVYEQMSGDPVPLVRPGKKDSFAALQKAMDKHIFGDEGVIRQIKKYGVQGYLDDQARTYHTLKQYTPILGYFNKKLSMEAETLLSLKNVDNLSEPLAAKLANITADKVVRMESAMGEVVQSAIQKYFSNPKLKGRITFDNVVSAIRNDYSLFVGAPDPLQSVQKRSLANVELNDPGAARLTADDFFHEIANDLDAMGGKQQIQELFTEYVDALDAVRESKEGRQLLKSRYSLFAAKANPDVLDLMYMGHGHYDDIVDKSIHAGPRRTRFQHATWDVTNRWGALGDMFRHPGGKLAMGFAGAATALSLMVQPNLSEDILQGMAGNSTEQYDWRDHRLSSQQAREILHRTWSNTTGRRATVTRSSPQALDRDEAIRHKRMQEQSEALVSSVFGRPSHDLSVRRTDRRTRIDRGTLESWRNMSRANRSYSN